MVKIIYYTCFSVCEVVVWFPLFLAGGLGEIFGLVSSSWLSLVLGTGGAGLGSGLGEVEGAGALGAVAPP